MVTPGNRRRLSLLQPALVVKEVYKRLGLFFFRGKPSPVHGLLACTLVDANFVFHFCIVYDSDRIQYMVLTKVM